MKKWIVRIYFFLILVESLAVVINQLNRLDGSDGLRSIFSWINLFLLLIPIGVGVFCVWNLIKLFSSEGELKWIERIKENNKVYWGIAAVFTLILIESLQDLLFLHANLKEIYYPLSLRENRSLLVWGALISFETIIGLILLRWKEEVGRFTLKKEITPWLLIGIVVGMIILISGSGGSLPTNAPIPFLHLLIVLVVVIAGGLGVSYLKRDKKWPRKILQSNLIPFILLWAAAFIIWGSVSFQPNYFIDTPRPPNFEYSPTSDAIYYETQAHRFLEGEGFDDQTQHPIYSYLISGLHWIGGDRYEDIYRIQIALLAFSPFLLYLLASQLGTRFSGWLVAGLFILREHNALMLGDSITVSNVQLLMTEPVATLGVILSLYLIVTWLKDPIKRSGYPFLIGSTIGIVTLIRVELLSLVIVLGFISLLILRKSTQKWVMAMVVILVALFLVITPWMVRNYQRTGTISLDKGVVLEWARDRYIIQNTPGDSDQTRPEEQDNGILQRINIKQLKRVAVHSSNSFQQSLVYLPSNHLFLGGIDNFLKIVPDKGKIVLFKNGLISDDYITSYIKSLPYWHVRWKGNIAYRSFLPLLFSIISITLGLYSAWKKHKWIGFIPLTLMIVHVGIYAFFIGSGGRYIQVVDWITMLYLCLGIGYFIDYLLSRNPNWKIQAAIRNDDQIIEDRINRKKSIGVAVGVGIVLILVGLSMPLVESSIPRKYTFDRLYNRIEEYKAESIPIPVYLEQAIHEDKGEPLLDLLYGKALYPGFFEADEEILDDRSGRIPESGIPRIVFNLVGTEHIWVSLPISTAPEDLPHGSDVVVLGKITRDSEEYLAIKLQPYFLADQIFVLPGEDLDSDIIHLMCDLESCQP